RFVIIALKRDCEARPEGGSWATCRETRVINAREGHQMNGGAIPSVETGGSTPAQCGQDLHLCRAFGFVVADHEGVFHILPPGGIGAGRRRAVPTYRTRQEGETHRCPATVRLVR